MTEDERTIFRRRFGVAIMKLQDEYRGVGPDVMVPEMIAARLSFAAYVTRHNAGLGLMDFRDACLKATHEQWPPP